MKINEVISKKTYRDRRTERIPVFVFPDLYGEEESEFWDWLKIDYENRIELDDFEYGPIVLQLLNPNAYRDAPTQFVTAHRMLFVVDDVNEGEAIQVHTPLDRIIHYLRDHAEASTFETPIDKEKYPNI